MRFFENHFNKHHLLHAPHKWFLALLISPLHAAEVHYQKRYHLRFAHARKLFLFDLCLIALVFLSASSALFWYLYDPTVTKNVSLELNASTDKIKNGEYITYTINYHNTSDVSLMDANLVVGLPKGFLIDKVEPKEIFSEHNKTFSLYTLSPGANGTVSVSGWLYNTVDEKALTVAHLSYKQSHRNVLEQKITKVFVTPRDSVLSMEISSLKEVISSGIVEVKIVLTNNGEKPLEGIKVPLQFPAGKILSSNGTINEKNIWEVPSPFLPKSSTTLSLIYQLGQFEKNQNIEFSATPEVQFENEIVKLTRVSTFNSKVITPDVQVSTAWKDNVEKIQPGQRATLFLTIKNNSELALHDTSIVIPITNSVDVNTFSNSNHGVIQKNTLRINPSNHAALQEIQPGKSVILPVVVPIRNSIEGENIVLTLTPTIESKFKNINAIFKKDTSTSPIKVGTKLTLDASIRYYTQEGDQLGRGPLPPTVGKETKYWALIRLRNTTSEVQNIVLSADLPSHIQWTGKSSVSHGKEPIFNPNTRQVRWGTASLKPGENAGVYMELSLTPTTEQRGTTPIILKNIQVLAEDSFINDTIALRFKDLDTSLPQDALAKIKGVIVK